MPVVETIQIQRSKHPPSAPSFPSVQREARGAEERVERGIPQLAVITKIDEVCPEIQEGVKNVYKSKLMKAKMEEFSAQVGIPMNCIFPVKNYYEENNVNSDINSLILDSLRGIIHSGDDYFEHQMSQTDSD
ncbi:hypothetical protein GBF38_000398 [Nibea albiflora]|nr:hypothetical protein GBF38_000398 [Nibea albiflora]